jgi:hypothetical protein
MSAAEAGERLPDAPLENLDSITMRVGNSLDNFHVVIYFFKRGTVLRVEGHGDKRLAVQGVFEDLRATLESSSRDVPHEFAVAVASSVIGVVLSTVSILGHGVVAGLKWRCGIEVVRSAAVLGEVALVLRPRPASALSAD